MDLSVSLLSINPSELQPDSATKPRYVHLKLQDIPSRITKRFVDIYRWDAHFADSQLCILLDEYNEMVDVLMQTNKGSSDESDDSVMWASQDTVTNTSSPVYEVILNSKTLGMTIENVMERTIVRTVQASSEAAKLGIKTNSLLLQVGNTRTMDHTHLETLDLLKNAVRPVRLRLRKLDAETVSQRRSQMQALVQRQKLQVRFYIIIYFEWMHSLIPCFKYNL